jgi:hypothetical protein
MKKILAIIIVIFLSTSLFGQKKNASKNNVKKMIVYEQKFDKNNGKNTIDSEVIFDTNGNIIEEIEYKDGKIDRRVKSEFDPKGTKLKEKEFDSTGKLTKLIEYKYKGDLRIERNVYDKNYKLKSKKTYQYEIF